MADGNPLEGLLSKDELELIKRRRAEEQKNRDQRVKIRSGDNEAELPFGEAQSWLREKFGIGVKDDGEIETKDDKETEGEGEAADEGGTRRFGRRVG